MPSAGPGSTRTSLPSITRSDLARRGPLVCLRPGVWHSGPRRSRTSADALASLRAVFDPLTACGRCALLVEQAMGLIDQESAMRNIRGSPRKLTNRQIREVLKWHQEAIEFRHSHGTLHSLAGLLGVSVHAVRGCFEGRIPAPGHDRRNLVARSLERRGHPRHLNPAHVSFVIAWHNEGRRFHARRGNVASWARRLGVSASTIHDCIRRKGRYKRRAHVEVCKARNLRLMSDDALRAILLRAWLRPNV